MRIWIQAPPNQRRHLKAIARTLRRVYRERKICPKDLNLVIVDDAEIRRLNRQFLGCSHSTDVISFAGEGELLGEIAICADTAKRQARRRGVPLEHEYLLLAVHGLLHLDGLDDTKLPRWKEMKRAEFEMMAGVL